MLKHNLQTLALALLLFGTTTAFGQLQPLPPVSSDPDSLPGGLVSHPDSAAELPQPLVGLPSYLRPNYPHPHITLSESPTGQPACVTAPADATCRDPDLPPDARNGMFQKLIVTANYLPGGGSNQLGVAEVDLRTMLALPIPSRKAPLLITPGFGTYFLQRPATPDLPPQLHDAYIQFRWMRRWHPRLGTDVAITPGVYGDFNASAGDSIRLPGHGAALWTWNDRWKVLLGCAYLDRLETNILPIGGLIWTPNEDVNYEMVFPKPKLAHRVRWSGACDDQTQDWVYLAGEFGGSAWAIRRADGSDDEVDYRDWRVLLGIERKAIGRLDYRCEIGYVFARRFLYDSSSVEYEPDDTIMVRLGATY